MIVTALPAEIRIRYVIAWQRRCGACCTFDSETLVVHSARRNEDQICHPDIEDVVLVARLIQRHA